MKSKAEFITKLIDRFPAIKEEVLDEDHSQYISLQMGCVKWFAQDAIDHNNNESAKAIFNFWKMW